MTKKGLEEVYDRLRDLGFTHKQVEQGMENCFGSDLVTCINWLCLNIRHEDLPEGISDKTGYISGDKKIEFVVNTFEESGEIIRESRNSESENIPETAEIVDSPQSVSSKKRISDEAKSKDWILKYVKGNDSDTSDSESEAERRWDKERKPEEWIEEYRRLKGKIEKTKKEVNSAKGRGDSKLSSRLKKALKVEQEELKVMEKISGLNLVKMVAQAEREKKEASEAEADRLEKPKEIPDVNEQGEDQDSFNIFDFEEDCQDSVLEGPIVFVRDFKYSKWTGQNPKQLLHSTLRKYLGTDSSVKYAREHKDGYAIPSATLTRSGRIKSYSVDYFCKSAEEAANCISTVILFELFSHLPLYSRLPPPLRNLWFELEEAVLLKKLSAFEEENREKMEFINSMLERSRLCVDSRLGEDTDFVKAETANFKTRIHKNSAEDEMLIKLLKEFEARRKCCSLRKKRKELPIFNFRDNIISKVSEFPVVVICGDTGCGKTTQVPQFILSDMIHSGKGSVCNIICTEPRRLSTTYVAKRVSEELSDEVPGSKKSLCGYQIRLEAKRSSHCRMLFCTTGVLLRKLRKDPYLSDVSHVIVDEVHERSLHSDLLLIHLKDILKVRNDLKVILMSATVDADKLSFYFDGAPVVNVPGRTFPVEDFFLEDIVEFSGYQLEEDSIYSIRDKKETTKATFEVSGMGGSKETIAVEWEDTPDEYLGEGGLLDPEKYSKTTRLTIDRMNQNVINYEAIEECLKWMFESEKFKDVDGSVLVFLSGFAEISICYEMLTNSRLFGNEQLFNIIPLHSVIDSDKQACAFDPPKIRGQRKIILSTNISETGITIPDVVFVIDTGKVKETRYNEHKRMCSLEEVFISQASSAQRKGRAGRVRPGFCFKLFSRARFHKMEKYTLPELLRTPLEELCLHIVSCGYGDPERFLQKALDPPSSLTITTSLGILKECGALDKKVFELTALGEYLSCLPVDVRVGKMIIFASVFGCLDPILTISAAESFKSPFLSPFERREESAAAKKSFACHNSDQLTLYNAYQQWSGMRTKGRSQEHNFCKRYFLNQQSLVMIESLKTDLLNTLEESGFVKSNIREPTVISHLNRHSKNIELVKAVLSAGLSPNIAVCKKLITDSSVCHFYNKTERVFVHPQSVNGAMNKAVSNDSMPKSEWLVFQSKMKTKRLFIRDTTFVNPLSLLLFGGELSLAYEEQLIRVGDCVELKCSLKTSAVIMELRKELDKLLSVKFENPDVDIFEAGKCIADCVVLLLSS